MSERGEDERRRDSGTGEDMHSDTDPAKGTPEIGDESEPGQTQAPAEGGDVGVPEEIPDRTE
jgi:hypothetical protein